MRDHRSALTLVLGAVTVGTFTWLYRCCRKKPEKGSLLELLAARQNSGVITKKVVLFGIDGAGKTTMHRTLFDKPIENIVPTQGFSITSLARGGKLEVNVWDLAGNKFARPYWTNYLDDLDVIVYVIDSSDVQRIPEAREAFKGLMAEEKSAKVPVLIVANRQDLPHAKSLEYIASPDGLNMKALAPGRKWQVMGWSDATKDAPSLKQGFEWAIEECQGK